VKVDLSSQIYRWRQELDALGKADPMKKLMSQGMSVLFGHPAVYTGALRLSPMVNWIPGPLISLPVNPWTYGHEMMKFPKKSFHQLWKEKKL
jgi:L-lactate dehydrogenase complex protein LldF